MESTGMRRASGVDFGSTCIPVGCRLGTKGSRLAAPAPRVRSWTRRLSRSAPFHAYYLETNKKPWSEIPGIKGLT